MSKEKVIWYEDTLVYPLKGSHSAGISLACKAWLPKWRVYKWKILLFSQMSPGCKCLPTVNPAVYPALLAAFFSPAKHKRIQKGLLRKKDLVISPQSWCIKFLTVFLKVQEDSIAQLFFSKKLAETFVFLHRYSVIKQFLSPYLLQFKVKKRKYIYAFYEVQITYESINLLF